jgi:hypothetical protein
MKRPQAPGQPGWSWNSEGFLLPEPQRGADPRLPTAGPNLQVADKAERQSVSAVPHMVTA